MKKILLLGAGRSSSSLIRYLLDKAPKFNWLVRIGDRDRLLVESKIQGSPYAESFEFDVNDSHQRILEIGTSDLVISMLPPHFHLVVAQSCVELSKDMVTASYCTPELTQLNGEAKSRGVLLLNEVGVDPGIDHMSAMSVIHRIQDDGGKVVSFVSDTGGLVAPQYDTNPWNYKFTWNPMNVVTAGAQGARFLDHGRIKHLPYHRVFQLVRPIYYEGLGEFEAYANRDSLGYRKEYGLQSVETIIRGTIRRAGFCSAWNHLVQLGMTDSSFELRNNFQRSYREFTNTFLPYEDRKLEDKLASFLNVNIESDDFAKLKWLGLLEEEAIGMDRGTPSQILLDRLLQKWSLDSGDKDMIVMRHVFDYIEGNRRKRTISSFHLVGEDTEHTAMSLTVGLPVGIASKLILFRNITRTGVHIPVHRDIYEPILKELYSYGIRFKEETKEC